MKSYLLTAIIAILAISSSYAEEQGLVGNWITEKGTVRITDEKGILQGVAIKGEVVKESKGNALLKEVVADKTGWKGKFYVPRLGKYASMTCTLEDPKSLKITVKAGFLTRSVTWKRAEAK